MAILDDAISLIGESIMYGDIAQLVERTDRTREARGSNPLISK